MATIKRWVLIVAPILLLFWIAGWALDHYFGITIHPKRNPEREVALNAQDDINKAYKEKGTEAWNGLFEHQLSLSDVDKRLTEQDELKEAREIVNARHSSTVQTASVSRPTTLTSSRARTWEWRPPLGASTQALGNGTYKVTIDPRILWQNTRISVRGKHTMIVTTATADKMCSPPEPCVGPEGLTNLGFARFETIRRDEYVDGNAIYHELIGQFDNNQPFRIGANNTIQIPEGADSVHFMPNIRKPYLNETGGGWVMQVTIQ